MSCFFFWKEKTIFLFKMTNVIGNNEKLKRIMTIQNCSKLEQCNIVLEDHKLGFTMILKNVKDMTKHFYTLKSFQKRLLMKKHRLTPFLCFNFFVLFCFFKISLNF